jgi:hypothetical protein
MRAKIKAGGLTRLKGVTNTSHPNKLHREPTTVPPEMWLEL